MFKLYSSWSQHPVEVKHFPDNSLNIKLPHCHISMIEWHYENDAEIFTLACIKRHYDEIWNGNIILRMPYVPHARMDRVKNENDVFTLKYFCEIINSLNFYTVKICDPHSNVAPALLNNCVIHHPYDNVNHVIKRINDDSLVLFFPDEGAMKRYSGETVMPYAFGVKKRNWESGKIESLELIGGEIVEGNAVLIVDDICSYGGTFVHAAKALRAAGASAVYLYVTHCEQNIFKGEVFDNVDKVFTTDSIFVTPEGDNRVEVISK